MMHSINALRYGLAILVTLCSFAFTSNVSTVAGQDKPVRRSTQTGRDPFSKYVPPRPPVKSTGLVMPPSIQERVAQYKAQKASAMSARVPAPKPTTAFLLNEIQVVGISRTPRGYAAIVEAMPIKLSYVIYPGERFYDGQLVAIEDHRLVFRRETVFTDGRRERSVEMKALRQANMAESMAAEKQTPTGQTVAASDKPAEQKPATEKP